MSTLIVRGGRALSGTVHIGGSKNAALPLLFATLLTRGVSVFGNVPDIADVQAALSILRAYGAVVSFPDDGYISVDTTSLTDALPPMEDVKKIRASSYLLGATLGRFKRALVLPFGGCAFCDRPIDMHLSAAISFGAVQNGTVLSVPDRLVGTEITFSSVSVGATVNALLMAVCAEGESVIRGAAVEPHVLSLLDYLNRAGADISQKGNTFYIKHTGALHGATVDVIPDMIEAGTYLLSGIMTGGEVTVTHVDPKDLSSFVSVLERAGVSFQLNGQSVTAKAENVSALSVQTGPYPGFPTDLQPQIAAMMARFSGGEIIEKVFPERFGYLSSLSALGVRSQRGISRVKIFPSEIKAGSTGVFDLRGGAAAWLTALCAKGESKINYAEILLRGYEKLSTKLSALGADVEIQ